ncbi:aminoacyl-tRNA deacylase [Mailhella massiliensis]|uniref:Deacylase n=1 Tax=Mailhella massiliensis TaxID=1903261 RepID=A0A921DRA4_9BACT|nr:YbaK/EbsC family protein [Mailhella massiliensis]HJD96816.1 deacylase [Mailhella massiliensis]
MTDMFNEAPALRILHAAGMEAAGLKYAYEEHGGTRDAAEKLGVDEHLVVKSLVFDNGLEGEERLAVMALIHGDERVSMHKLERLSGIRRLLPSSPDTAFALTGYMPGGICPFGLKTPLPVFVQETLLELPILYINAGVRGMVAALHPSALSLISPIPGDLSGQQRRRTF